MQIERITDHSSAFIGCLAWIPLAVWILACVNWSITGDIDPITGILGVAVAVGLGYEAINPPVPAMAPLTVLAVLITVVMFPFVRAAMNKRELRGVEVEALEKAYQALSVRPDNVIAKIKIAKLLFNLGMCGHALRIAESLAPSMSPRFFADELRMLKQWQRTPLDARYFTPIACADCHTSNDPGLLYCRQCGAPFPLDFAKGRVVGPQLGRRLLSTWIALIAILIGIPEAQSLPAVPAVLTISVMMVVAVGMVYLAFRDPDRGVIQ